MKNVHILFIDDEDISEIVSRIKIILRKQGFTLFEKIFTINNSFRKVNPKNENETILDFELIKTKLKDEAMLQRFDYVVSDFNFKDENVNGFKLIKWIKNVSKSERIYKIRRARFSLYSSEKDKSIKETFSEDDLGSLIKLKLEDFYDRARISEEFGTSIISNSQEINLKDKFIEEIDKYSELDFINGYPKFKNLKLKEIVSEIEDDTHHGIKFQETLIELTIAQLVSLNQN